MKYLLLLFCLPMLLSAGEIHLVNGRLIQGDLQWHKSFVKHGDQNYDLKNLLRVDFEKPLVDNEGEYIIFSDGSMIKAQSLKLDNKMGHLLINYRETELKVDLAQVSAFSFQGAKYPPKNTLPGFLNLNDFYNAGQVSYFTRSMLGQTKPQKNRYKKSMLKFLYLKSWENSTKEFKVFTTSREIIFAKIIEVTNESLKLDTILGSVEYPLEEISAIENLSKFKALNAEQIKNISYTPFLTQCKEMTYGNSFTGSAVEVGGFATKDFWSIHSRTNFDLMVPKGGHVFSTILQLDPLVKNGNIQFLIQQNGKELINVTMAGGKEKKIRIPVKMGIINIVVDYGQGGSAGDFLLMCKPRFLLEK
ncbi:hypothetical protein PQO03_00960 [Lentisphaera profundi]|uniref:Glycosyl hydrolase family 98 putative carbohydrate-binding module domain-containing protein n=1 Tax=Lentisphaera profundi TaxID=1658616 RepID=A0ABY7VTI4_9BACT|nr:hypothetical protein [Lentisphaera profundi]WDE96535.1 hypothetical protein PQO03_00960 [Lentisphaera profundi]